MEEQWETRTAGKLWSGDLGGYRLSIRCEDIIVLKSKTLSRKAKLNVYKTIIRHVVAYGSET
jgi:hypothetical protein